jgi:hypothetical protein
MQWHRQPVSRSFCFIVKSAITVAAMMTMLLTAPARTETEGAAGPNPDNVLVMPKPAGSLFVRWTATPATAAEARKTKRYPGSRSRKPRTAPAEPPAVEAQHAEPAWPNAAATAGQGTLIPMTLKTVREMIAPEPETPLVFENELSDIDLAARPALAATPSLPPPPSTDGRATWESEIADPSPVYAMAETMRTIAQSAWFEPVLLVLAGALAAVTAIRVFA